MFRTGRNQLKNTLGKKKTVSTHTDVVGQAKFGDTNPEYHTLNVHDMRWKDALVAARERSSTAVLGMSYPLPSHPYAQFLILPFIGMQYIVKDKIMLMKF